MRYLFTSPPFWTEELARFLLIWLTFIGVIAVQISHDQIGINWISEMLPPTGKHILQAINNFIVLLILIAIAWSGYSIVQIGTQVSPALGISMQIVYAALPIGAVITLIVVAGQLIEEIVAIFSVAEEVGNGD
tara:strand:- start:4928 stop:5326 length:399 start_codon:yes stop_codon:yes gene_type:complete